MLDRLGHVDCLLNHTRICFPRLLRQLRITHFILKSWNLKLWFNYSFITTIIIDFNLESQTIFLNFDTLISYLSKEELKIWIGFCQFPVKIFNADRGTGSRNFQPFKRERKEIFYNATTESAYQLKEFVFVFSGTFDMLTLHRKALQVYWRSFSGCFQTKMLTKHKKSEKWGITIPRWATSRLVVSKHCIFQSSDPPFTFLRILSLEVKGLAVDGDDERWIILNKTLLDVFNESSLWNEKPLKGEKWINTGTSQL